MTYSIVSLALSLVPVALLAGVVLAIVGYVAGNVFQVWGTTSTREWIFEAMMRIVAGSLRQRLMRKVKRQFNLGVFRSFSTHPFLAVSVSVLDVATLTAPGCTLMNVATDAAKGYERHAAAEGWASHTTPQVAVVPEEWLRRGSVVVRPVSSQEFLRLADEMAQWDAPVEETDTSPEADAGRATHVDRSAPSSPTRWLADSDLATAAVDRHEQVTEPADPASALTMPATPAARIVLTDSRGGRHAISSSSIRIGRGPKCAVRMEGAEVSREHADVYLQEGIWWLRDRGSRNGTTVDGKEVQGAGPVLLRSGSQIVLGGVKAGATLTIDRLVEV